MNILYSSGIGDSTVPITVNKTVEKLRLYFRHCAITLYKIQQIHYPNKWPLFYCTFMTVKYEEYRNIKTLVYMYAIYVHL